MFYWLVECFILQSLLNMLLHDELEGKYLCTEITQLHCAVVVYSVCHVILHLGVTSMKRRGRTLQSVNISQCVVFVYH